MSKSEDIVKRLLGYAEIPDMDRQCQRDIAEAAAEIVSLRGRYAKAWAECQAFRRHGHSTAASKDWRDDVYVKACDAHDAARREAGIEEGRTS